MGEPAGELSVPQTRRALSRGSRKAVKAYRGAFHGVEIAAAVELAAPFVHRDGACFTVQLPELARWADLANSSGSPLVLMEDGNCLGPPHASHADIAASGAGAYSHWGETLLFSSSDGTDPNSNGRTYLVVVPRVDTHRAAHEERPLLGPYSASGGRMWMATISDAGGRADHTRQRRSFLRLYENGQPLGPAHSYHDRIRDDGEGRYSHWGEFLYFSSSDGTDPNRNGRRYTYRLDVPAPTPRSTDKRAYLDRWYRKRELFVQEPAGLWSMHPEADWFREHGGLEIPPPIYANLVGLTSYCNLKCTICGSQEAIDHEGVPRRNMSPETMAAVSDTIFPTLIVLILASLGEPTIYPHFNQVLKAAHRWGTSIKLESNATALTPRMVELLTAVRGELFFSIDATGPLFEDVRRGARWDKVDANVRRLMAARDPELTKVNLYPTISRRTLADMHNVARWGLDVGIEEITFHSYDPTMFAKEERPAAEEFAPQKDRIREWLDVAARERDVSGFSVKVNGVEINPRFSVEDSGQYPLGPLPKNHPFAEDEYEPGGWRCNTPKQNVDIGPDGEIYPCVWSGVRPQENTMGRATSKEAFAEAWFGARYVELRDALRVDSGVTPNVAQCETCLKRYALRGDRMS